ncbi:MAG: trehalose-phosphatase [Actinobacteria bacterium]|nr:trehalose-phosphatase [Actinomycetota bacterium]
MSGGRDPALGPLHRDPSRAGVFLDFDGSLSEIVDRPEDARAVPGAAEAVAALVPVYRVVAVVTGRPSAEIRRLLDVPGVLYAGLYGLEPKGAGPAPALPFRLEVDAVVATVPGARVEPKGLSLAVHYRGATDREAARRRLEEELARVVEGTGYEVIEGKMVLELVPSGRSRKGGAVRRLVEESGVGTAMYAGDDVADLEAFEALDELAGEGLAAVKVVVAGPETPARLVEAADVTVDGPRGLVELLRSLAQA